ncbi:MAG TPA: hypothetical protein DGG95_17480 [Cytophagales bacterium]|jgi:hypothetical protein|nr:hypothetical protein [Cytophagales bacterium]
MRISVIVILNLWTYTVNAQNITGEIELGGFMLGQYRTAVHNELGRPIKKIKTDDGWIYEFHNFKKDTSVYGLFKYPSWDTLRLFAIQINGHRYEEMHPFKGLKLGNTKEEVKSIFGDFESKQIIENPTVTVQYYKHKNYSLEIDQNNKLYGIQIFGSILGNKTRDVSPSFESFKQTLNSKNTDSLLQYLMPDIEIYVNNKVIGFWGSARKEFQRRDSELVKYLLGTELSVLTVLTNEKTKATAELRFMPENKISATATVFKFYESKVLQEIVFIPFAGKWRVYEIKFR